MIITRHQKVGIVCERERERERKEIRHGHLEYDIWGCMDGLVAIESIVLDGATGQCPGGLFSFPSAPASGHHPKNAGAFFFLTCRGGDIPQ